MSDKVPQKIVLAYSGSLDSSVAIHWLKEHRGAEIVAVSLDLGQGRELNQIRERAMAAGAMRCHVLDAREEFARDYILPSLQADALHDERYPMPTALGRPLIAKKLVEIARMENASVIAYGCTGTGNDQLRIEAAARAIDPGMTVIAPAREWDMTRAQEIEYARVRNIPVPVTLGNLYNADQNLWGRSIDFGVPDDPPEDIYTLTKAPGGAPEEPAYVQIEWQNGVPTAVSGVEMSLVELISSLETIAGVHGVGRLDTRDERVAAGKSRRSTSPRGALSRVEGREIYEVPAALVLHMAHREIEALVIPEDLQRLKPRLSREYADVIYNGLWFSPTRSAIDAFMQNIQQRVTGTIRLKLFKGGCRVVARTSPFALVDEPASADQQGDALDHAAEDGVLKISDLPSDPAKNAGRHAAPASK